MKMRVRDLKALVKLLSEADEAQPQPTEEGGDSLDAQVDRYLASYETEAKSAQMEGVDLRAMTRSFLTEADDDVLPGEGGNLSSDDIDVESFVNSVVRLMDNYDSLLEVRNTLLRRAKLFLAKTYDEAVVEAYERLMRDEHGIEDGKSEDEVAGEEFPAPTADRAGSGGEGPGAPPA